VTTGKWNDERLAQRRDDLNSYLTGSPEGYTLIRDVLEGDAATMIVEYAQERRAELIVMATHGYGPFRRFLLGSVTAKVLHDAHCPVWTGPHLESAPVSQSIKFRRILCAIDLSDSSPAVLHWAEEFARKCDAGLAVIHVLPRSLIQLGGVYFDPEWRTEVAAVARKQIEKLSDGRQIDIEVLIAFGETGPAVADLVRSWRADLLVIGRGGDSGLFERLHANAYSILRESPCPVVAV
jgi:nucleotide-binding universal stress UspA family protein